MKIQLLKLKEDIEEYSSILSNGCLHRRVMWRAFWDTLWSSIRYKLPTLHLKSNESENLSKLLYKLLASLPLSFQNGSMKYFWMGITHAFFAQTISKIDHFIMHEGANTYSIWKAISLLPFTLSLSKAIISYTQRGIDMYMDSFSPNLQLRRALVYQWVQTMG